MGTESYRFKRTVAAKKKAKEWLRQETVGNTLASISGQIKWCLCWDDSGLNLTPLNW
jgi:hypothetical protein